MRFLLAAVVLCLCLGACSEHSSNSIENGSSAQPNTEVPDTSSKTEELSESKPTDDEEVSNHSALPTHTVTFPCAENGHVVYVTLDVPKSWYIDSERQGTLIADGKFEVEFYIVSNLDGFIEDYSHPYFVGLDKEFLQSGSGKKKFLQSNTCKADGKINIPGMLGKYYYIETKNADETVLDIVLKYYICIGKKAVFFEFMPADGVDVETQRKEFEAYLSTLEILS